MRLPLKQSIPIPWDTHSIPPPTKRRQHSLAQWVSAVFLLFFFFGLPVEASVQLTLSPSEITVTADRADYNGKTIDMVVTGASSYEFWAPLDNEKWISIRKDSRNPSRWGYIAFDGIPKNTTGTFYQEVALCAKPVVFPLHPKQNNNNDCDVKTLKINIIPCCQTEAPPSDTTDPSLTISSPYNGFTTIDSTVTVKGTASDSSGISKLQYSVNGGSWKYISVSYSWSQTVPLQLGSNTIRIKATDRAGNSRTKSITVTRAQNHNPYIDIIDVPPKATPGQPYTIRLRPYDPDNNVKTLRIDWGRGNVQTYNASSGQTVSLNHTYPNAGSYTWTATAYDAQNKHSATVRYNVLVGADNFDMRAVENARRLAPCPCLCNGPKPKEGNPIDPAMGAQVVSETFMKVQGVIPITFTLTYNSILLTEGVVGTGWGVNLYETSLRELSNGDVEVHWDANHANLFKKAGNQYSAVDGACRFDKLVKNANGTFMLSRQNKTIYEFNADGQLLKLRNPKNQALIFQYDGAGRMTRVTEPVSGVFLNYTYNSYGLIATITDPLNRQVRLGYDANRHLISVTDAANRVTKYTYNKFGQKLTTTLDGVLLSSNTYDPKGTGRIVAQEDNRSGNQPIRFTYPQQANIVIAYVTGRNGDTRVYRYVNYRLVSQKDRLGNIVQYTYDTNGKLTATTNANQQTTRFTYDSRGNLIRVVNPANHTRELAYDANNNLISTKNALGEITRFAYDGNNNLMSETDPLGKVTRYTYNGYGQVVSMTNPRGKRTIYQYQQGRLVAITVQDGHRQTLAYDAAGRVIKVTTPNGDATTLTYDAVDRVVAITDPLNRTTRMTYDSRDNLLTLTDANGNIIRNSYDGNGNLMSRTDALGKITRYEYDGEDRLIKVIDANNGATQLRYDAKGRLISTTNPLGGTRTTTYDANDLPLTITDAEGQIQTFEYDELGRLTSIKDAEGFLTGFFAYDALNRPVVIADILHRAIRMTYDKNGNLLTITDFNGNVTERTYDDNDNLISQTDALGNQTRYQYDNNDQLIRVIDANNHATQLGYDAKGRLISITDALGHKRKLAYDKADNLLQQFDALGKALKTITYDKVDNPLTIIDATNQSVSFEYDKLNRLTRTTDPLNRVTEFQYDKLNRLVASVDALRGQSTQSFDANGNRTQLTDANQQKTQFSFDKSGRLVTETLASGSKLTYRYNARDLLTEMTNARGQQRQFKYDYVGRLTQITDSDGTVSYTYDRNDNVLTVKDKNGTITREYDKRNRVVKYTDSQGNTIQYGYDAVGNLVKLTYPNGKVVQYEYDAVNQLTKVTDWAQRVTRYSYDANGRLTTVQRPNGTSMTRTYHATGQLAQQKDVTQNGEVISQFDFHYDAAGNISEEKMNPAPEPFPLSTVQMTYSAANRLASYDQQTVPYDADGNMEKIPLADALTAASFDSRNRLTQVGNTAYRYDAENQRIAVDATHYVINPQAVLSQVLVKTTRDGTSTYYVYGLGLIGEETNGAYQAYHHDLRGSTVALTDASGTVVDRYQYSAFAQLVNHEGISDTPFLYNGRDGVMTDANGLYYMRARYYNPEIRRFVNQDVLLGNVAEGQTLNRYAYVTGNPVSYVDPFGLSPENSQNTGNGEKSLKPVFDIMKNTLQPVSEFFQGGFKVIEIEDVAHGINSDMGTVIKVIGDFNTVFDVVDVIYSTVNGAKNNGVSGAVENFSVSTTNVFAGSAATQACLTYLPLWWKVTTPICGLAVSFTGEASLYIGDKLGNSLYDANPYVPIVLNTIGEKGYWGVTNDIAKDNADALYNAAPDVAQGLNLMWDDLCSGNLDIWWFGY